MAEAPFGQRSPGFATRNTVIYYLLACGLRGAIAKWLRRQIRNLFSFGGAGSNPAGVGSFLTLPLHAGLNVDHIVVGRCAYPH